MRNVWRGGVVMGALVLSACGDVATAPTGGAASPASSIGAVKPRQPAATGTIVDIAVAASQAAEPQFRILVQAVVRAGFVEALSARGQRTVFAPTDAAFEAAGITLDNVDDVPVATLQAVLLYHVAPGARTAEDVVGSTQIRMANGQFTSISVTGEGAFINDSRIIATDIVATNGVIHVIDEVLLP